jgi:hypothetical protein
MIDRTVSDDGYLARAFALLACVILLSLAMYSLFIYPSYFSGMAVYSGMKQLSDRPVLAGAVTGYADTSGPFGSVSVRNPGPEPDKLGAVQMKIQLDSLRLMQQTGNGVDLDLAVVIFTSPYGQEILAQEMQYPLKKPGWAVVKKGGALSFQAANQNNILEPNEAFLIFVYPAAPLPPDTPFSVIIRLPDEKALVVNRTGPRTVRPLMNLG